jgi:putative membrane protein
MFERTSNLISESKMKISKMALAASMMIIATGSLGWSQAKTAEEFAAMAASSDMFEIQSSELALQKDVSPEVKEFAQMMINDHTTASKNLIAAAQQDGVSVPGEMTTRHTAKIGALGDLSGAGGFDAKYIDEQVAAHREALALMTAYAEGGDSPALKAHAHKTAPVIQMHFEHVQKLDSAM